MGLTEFLDLVEAYTPPVESFAAAWDVHLGPPRRCGWHEQRLERARKLGPHVPELGAGHRVSEHVQDGSRVMERLGAAQLLALGHERHEIVRV